SLAACEGAILVVDAAQGVEAQTVANVHLALKQKLTIVPVINKIDLPNADVPTVQKQLEDILAIPGSEAILASAKTGLGIGEILEAIVHRVPPPPAVYADNKLRTLIFDSVFDIYRGVVAYARLFSGSLEPGQGVKLMSTSKNYEVKEVGIFTPKPLRQDRLQAGDVGYMIANIKSTAEIKIGDTITDQRNAPDEPLPGFQEIHPMVFSGIYPINTADFEHLKTAMGKLQINDAAFTYQAENSVALGFGFRCGFLGLLHMEIVQERLERDYALDLIATSPSVVFRVTKTDDSVEMIDNPSKLPPSNYIRSIEEPYVKATIMTPPDYVGAIMDIAQVRRGMLANMEYLHDGRVIMAYEMPLIEVIVEFFDVLKSRTKGYASLDYELIGYREGDLVKLEILLNAEPVDALSFIIARDKAAARGRALAERLKELIPRQLFDVPIQAAIGGKIVARETVTALRKNVLAKCYGGDITRKRKLLEKQKAGKERMKRVGRVDLPQDAFMAVLKLAE
ncbi:MAG: elongation factor 4, partial [Acidobacteriales bacterium]|nr:elongation factor 4 [Terriglobales bacterium]